MAVLAQCPCGNVQSVKNKRCKRCDADLDKLKRQKEKVKYWINFRLPDGKQRREVIGYSLAEARDADGKRRVQKRENRIFDMLPEANMTFSELVKWYVEYREQTGWKKIGSYDNVRDPGRIKLALRNFNDLFGNTVVNSIKKEDLEKYQAKREKEGKAFGTIDYEISIVETMIQTALDNDKVSYYTRRVFKNLKRRQKKGQNARTRVWSFDEYLRITEKAPEHLRDVIILAFNTGMRSGEIYNLKRSSIDKEKMFIRLTADMTKESNSKAIPINKYALEVLNRQPLALQHEYVFTYRGKPIISRHGFVKSLRKACNEAGIPYGRETENGLTFHDIRGTVKTNMLRAGVDSNYRNAILGHSQEGMDKHYIRLDDDDLTRAMKKYTDWLDTQPGFGNVDQTVECDEKRT